MEAAGSFETRNKPTKELTEGGDVPLFSHSCINLIAGLSNRLLNYNWGYWGTLLKRQQQ